MKPVPQDNTVKLGGKKQPKVDVLAAEVKALRIEVAELRNQLVNLRSQTWPIIVANTRFG